MMKYNITITPEPDASPMEVRRRAHFLAEYVADYISKGGLFCDAIFTSAGRVQLRVTSGNPELPKEESKPLEPWAPQEPARVAPLRIVGRRLAGRRDIPFKAPSPEYSILPSGDEAGKPKK